MENKKETLQESFLRALCKKRSKVSIFLVNGVQLKGQIKDADNFTVLLMQDDQEQLIYKHAISTIRELA